MRIRTWFATTLMCFQTLPSFAAATNDPPVPPLKSPLGNVTTPAQWPARRAEILNAMQTVMGRLPGKEKHVTLDVQVSEETDCGAFVRRFLTYASEPNERVPAYLLIPKAALTNTSRKFPGVLALHQTHAKGQRVVVGLGESPNDEYGVELVRRGFVVLAPPYPLLANYQPDLKKLGWESGTMKAIWNNMRGLDLLASLPFVKTNGFGSIGHSLGGHNGVYTAAFDERIKVVVSSCGLDAYRDYMNGNIAGWTSTRYMPRLKELAPDFPYDFQDVLAAIAPRHVFISAPYGDTNFRWRSVDAVVAAALPVFQVFGARDHIEVEHPDCEHRFPPDMREKAYQLFDRILK
jgi:hypothetical protein